jgi:hypothetical protein
MNHLPSRLAQLFLRFGLLLVVVLLAAACTPGQIPQSGAGAPEAVFNISDASVTGSGGQVAPGITTITVNNTGQSARFVNVARLNPDVTIEQFLDTLSTDDMAAVELVTLSGGRDAPSGEVRQFTTELKEGTHVFIAFPEADGPPLTTAFQVSGEASGQAPPDADLTVDMLDFSYVMPAGLVAGEQTWEITNSGQQWHEIIILRPAPGVTQEQLLEMFASDQPPQGEPPFEEVGSFGPISAGERGWLPLELEAGTYMAVCFLPDFASGESHLEKGMIATFEIGP